MTNQICHWSHEKHTYIYLFVIQLYVCLRKIWPKHSVEWVQCGLYTMGVTFQEHRGYHSRVQGSQEMWNGQFGHRSLYSHSVKLPPLIDKKPGECVVIAKVYQLVRDRVRTKISCLSPAPVCHTCHSTPRPQLLLSREHSLQLPWVHTKGGRRESCAGHGTFVINICMHL